MRVADKQNLEEASKPHNIHLGGNEKDKIMEQYYAVKR